MRLFVVLISYITVQVNSQIFEESGDSMMNFYDCNEQTKELNQYHNIDIFEYIRNLNKNIEQNNKKERR